MSPPKMVTVSSRDTVRIEVFGEGRAHSMPAAEILKVFESGRMSGVENTDFEHFIADRFRPMPSEEKLGILPIRYETRLTPPQVAYLISHLAKFLGDLPMEIRFPSERSAGDSE